MKNMKIKSYKFKNNLVLNKDKSSNTIGKNKIEYTTLNNNVLSDVEKILKSPGLNISLSNENGNLKYVTKNSEAIFEKLGNTNENKINIKLNINSEVINNNIRINSKNEKSLDGTIPHSFRGEKNIENNEHNENIEYYEDLLKEKDRQIEALKSELTNANFIIAKYKKNYSSFDIAEGMKHSAEKNFNQNFNSTNGFNQYTSMPINPTIKTERKNLLTLDLTKKVVKKESSEIFSDRPKNNSNSLLKILSPTNQDSINFAKNPNFTSGSISQLFRQNNKTSIRLNDSKTRQGKGNSFLSSSTKSKPIDEVLKSTMALFESGKKDETREDPSTQDIIENLKSIKIRTHKLLNCYSDFVLNKKRSTSIINNS